MAIPNPANHRRRSGAKARADALLAWYDVNRRELPWRAKPGEPSDPYRVWISEIMLQQTTVAAVAPYYGEFLARWPDLHRLSCASQDAVLGAWAGLGYYSRARNLHRAAQILVTERRGIIPQTAAELRKLPGIGAYTSAAIAAIAFGERVAAMDANAVRVAARLFAFDEKLPEGKTKLGLLMQPLVPASRPGDFAQALMDLGSAICLPKKPHCSECPIARFCQARRRNLVDTLPRKEIERPRPLKRGAAFIAVDGIGSVYLVRRPENGLLGGMLQPPLGKWRAGFPNRQTALAEAPFSGDWRRKPGLVRHGFTHFELDIHAYVARFHDRPNGEGLWLNQVELKSAALPTVMRKVIAHALG